MCISPVFYLESMLYFFAKLNLYFSIEIQEEFACKADWAFMLDESQSVAPKQFKQQKEFLLKLVEALDPRNQGAHVSLFMFAIRQRPIVLFNTPQNFSTLENEIQNLEMVDSIDLL